MRLKRTIAVAGLCLPIGSSLANNGTVTSPADSVVLDDVVVRGKQANDPIVATAPVRSLTRADFEQQGVTDIADAMRRMAGVTLKDYGGAGGLKSVSVRGMGAQHTAVSYDGVLLNDAQNGMIDISRYSLDNLSALTLYIGDNADIFMPARNAAAAARLDIQTLSPVVRNVLEGKLKVGSFGLVSPSVRWEKRLTDKLSMVWSGEYLRADNQYPFDIVNGTRVTREKRDNSRIGNGHAEGNFIWTPKAGQELTAKLYYYDNASQLPGAIDLYNTINNETQHDRNVFAQVRYRGKLSEMLALSGLMKWNWTESLYKDKKASYPNGVNEQNYWQREYYASAALLLTPLQGVSAVYAADYFLNNLSSNGQLIGRPERNSVLQSLSAKYQNRYVVLTGRALYSIYRNRMAGMDASASQEVVAKQLMAKNIHRLSPSASLAVYPLGDRNLSLRASYKEIFRVPTFTENYCGRYMGSAVLDPEKTCQWNVGVGYSARIAGWLPELSVTLDYYTNHVDDKIVAMPITTYIWQYVNVGRVRTNGVDLMLSASFAPADGHRVMTSVNYSYQNALNVTDPTNAKSYKKQIAYIPKNSGGWSLTWENPWCNVVWHATFSGERWSTNNENSATHIDPYTEMGVALYRDFCWWRKQWSLRGDIINLFDKQYEVVRRYPMPGRSFKFTVGVRL